MERRALEELRWAVVSWGGRGKPYCHAISASEEMADELRRSLGAEYFIQNGFETDEEEEALFKEIESKFRVVPSSELDDLGIEDDFLKKADYAVVDGSGQVLVMMEGDYMVWLALNINNKWRSVLIPEDGKYDQEWGELPSEPYPDYI